MQTATIQPTQFVDAPARRLAGMQGHFTFETMSQIPALWGRFVPYLGRVPGQIGQTTFGLVTEMNDAGFQYLASVEVSDASDLPDDLSVSALPAQRYAVFTHHGSVGDLCVTIDAIWQQWLPTSGHTLVEAPHMMERYDHRFNPATASGEIEVWIPIQP